ncbi:alcohol dehydrogenase [Caballeronia fortuita]|uniref:Alcohol dehydrogenase n=1 Tax=Caballeronia fortuita TaxID=1777138 RepID=A0A158E3N7_9BURK|nr:zinc-dependent alcohol dehydrogenase family protein [Caballeronia fortuita]SAL00537.1 alcohol dehydrogenase [Caballeronia fortuita]
MARIITFARHGGPDVFEYTEAGDLAPAANEVRIRVKAIGLNRAESMWRRGAYVEPAKLPARAGYEASGIVDAIGANVTHVAVGDAVSTVPSFSMNDYGMYGERVLAPAHAVVKSPAWLSHEDAVAIWNVFVTPYAAFTEDARLKQGDVVLIPAASSGVGIGAIQVAKQLGATAVALTRTSAKRDALLELGADHVIVTDEENLVDAVMRITGGRGADLVFDPVGGKTLARLIDATRAGGTILLYGALSADETVLPVLPLLSKRITVHGYNLFSTTTDEQRQREAATFIFDGLRSGALRTVIAHRFAFERMADAHALLERNAHFGRIVVTV